MTNKTSKILTSYSNVKFHRSIGRQRIGCQTDNINQSTRINTSCKVAHSTHAGTTNHARKKRYTKRGTTQGSQRLSCEAENHSEPRQLTDILNKEEIKCITHKYLIQSQHK